jgi:hypothetical protein
MEAKDIAKEQWDNNYDLFKRMDDDADLVNLVNDESYIKSATGHAIPNTVHIVLDDAARFAWRVESVLNSAIEYPVCEAAKRGFDTDYVEDFCNYLFREIDSMLPYIDIEALNPFLDQQNVRRGRSAVRVTLKYENGKIVPQVVPYDTRYWVYWLNSMRLAGTSYKTDRTKSQVLSEYPNAKINKIDDIELDEIWTPEKNEIWIDNSKYRDPRNIYGEVPVVYKIVPQGSMLRDSDNAKYRGESIFFLIRDLLPELNRLVSIIQSLNLREVDRALQLKLPQDMIDANMAVAGHDEVTAPGTVNPVPQQGGYEYMPVGELRDAARLLHDMIQSRIDASTLNKLQTLQPKTATEILQVVQDQTDLIMPRLATRGSLKKNIVLMAIKQIKMLVKKGQFKLGDKDFDLEKLIGDYTLDYAYYFNDPKTDVARANIGISMRGLRPDYAIRRDIMQLRDPDGEEAQLRWEEAEQLSPLVKMYRTVRGLIKVSEEGDPSAEVEARLMLTQLLPAIDQAMAGQMTPQPQEIKQMPTNTSVGDLGGGII